MSREFAFISFITIIFSIQLLATPADLKQCCPERSPNRSISHVIVSQQLLLSIQFQSLPPFWLHSWLLFGSLLGSLFGSLLGSLPLTVLCGNIRKTKHFWAFEVSPERPFRGCFWAPFWLPFWDPFGWAFTAARGDGNVVFSHFISFKIIIFSIQLLPQPAGWKQCQLDPLQSSVPFVSRQLVSRQQLLTGPSGLKMKLS